MAYFSKLKNLINELVSYEPVHNCTFCGLKPTIEYQKRDCVMKFLMGLDPSYETIQAQNFMMKPFPSMNKAFLIRQQEEK